MTSYNLQAVSVLLVEKHTHMRRMIRDVLHEMGISHVAEAATKEEAFAMFAQEPFDLVMTDWAPGLNGIGLLKDIRIAETTTDPFAPVILVTANTEVRHVYAARDAGVNEYLAKPVSAKRIYARIRAIIESKRLFIRSRDFFGPDRRRHNGAFAGEDRRMEAARPDRRVRQLAFDGAERRHGGDGYHPVQHHPSSAGAHVH